jgi:hypothetical protein
MMRANQPVTQRHYSNALLKRIASELQLDDRLTVMASDCALDPTKGWSLRRWVGTVDDVVKEGENAGTWVIWDDEPDTANIFPDARGEAWRYHTLVVHRANDPIDVPVADVPTAEPAADFSPPRGTARKGRGVTAIPPVFNPAQHREDAGVMDIQAMQMLATAVGIGVGEALKKQGRAHTNEEEKDLVPVRGKELVNRAMEWVRSRKPERFATLALAKMSTGEFRTALGTWAAELSSTLQVGLYFSVVVCMCCS